MKGLLRSLLRSQQSGLVLVIFLLCVMLTVFAGSHVDRKTGVSVNNFLNPFTLMQTATDASFFAIMAIGITMVIISGGIDLSVGSIYALTGVFLAMALRALGPLDPGQTVAIAIALSLGIGVLCGLLNGLMVVWL